MQCTSITRILNWELFGGISEVLSPCMPPLAGSAVDICLWRCLTCRWYNHLMFSYQFSQLPYLAQLTTQHSWYIKIWRKLQHFGHLEIEQIILVCMKRIRGVNLAFNVWFTCVLGSWCSCCLFISCSILVCISRSQAPLIVLRNPSKFVW